MNLSERHIPGKKTILPYYIAASLSLVIISVMTLFSIREFKGHFFQPHLLAITHLTVFGWGTMIIMGASNQLMPVITDQKLYSDKLPIAGFVLLTLGTCLLVHCFWKFDLGTPIFVGAFSVLTALILHSANIFVTASKSPLKNITVDFVLTAHIWLILTAAIGITLLFNFRFGFLPADHLHYLKVHATAGMVGWFLLLVIGVSSRLIPMFLLSRNEVKIYLTAAYYLINAALLSFLIEGMIFRSSHGYLIYIMLISAGILSYVIYVRQCYKSAIRKKADAGMKVTLVAVCSIALPGIILLAYLLRAHEAPVSMITAYGYSFFAGFITTLIMGQTFKTLPFIVWMHLTKPDRLPELQPKNLYQENLVLLQIGIYLPGFLLFLSGILIQSQYLMYTGSTMMIIASIIYCGHVLHIIYQLRMKDLEITDPFFEEKARLLQMLSLVRDPELELNIVDLGLIYNIGIDKGKKMIEITMTLSTPACPAGDHIKGGVELMAKEAFPGYAIIIDLTFEPEWSADKISEAGRQELGW